MFHAAFASLSASKPQAGQECSRTHSGFSVSTPQDAHSLVVPAGLISTKCEREGTHFVEVDPAGTTKECASCGVETEKPLWVREHSCPACGFEADRDANAVVRLRLTGSKREAFARRGTFFLADSPN